MRRLRTRWTALSNNLGFLPGILVALFAAVGIAVVEIDRSLELGGVRILFQGDRTAARTVL